MSRPRRLKAPCARCESRERVKGLTICKRCREYHRAFGREHYARRKAERARGSAVAA